MLSAEREGVIHIMEQLNTFRKPVRRVDISINMEKTGANIRNLVKASGYSVRDIMTITGISTEQAIYKWYRGESIPALETMLILANALGIELKELLVIDGEFNNYGMCVGLYNEIMGSSGLTKLKSRISRNQWVERRYETCKILSSDMYESCVSKLIDRTEAEKFLRNSQENEEIIIQEGKLLNREALCTRFSRYFTVFGDRSHHFGWFEEPENCCSNEDGSEGCC